MAQKFDFDKIGQRLPYTMPEDTFDVIQDSVFTSLKKDRHVRRKRRIIRWSSISGIAAACVALLLIIKAPKTSQQDLLTQTSQQDLLTQIDVAYGNLSESDQEYLIEVYQEDFFLNQEQE